MKQLNWKIYTEEYGLSREFLITLEEEEGEFLAKAPDFELYSYRPTEFEAIEALRDEILDLFDELNELPDSELGPDPFLWKKKLNHIIKEKEYGS